MSSAKGEEWLLEEFAIGGSGLSQRRRRVRFDGE